MSVDQQANAEASSAHSQWRGAIEYERRRLSTVRAPWILLAFALGAALFLGLLEGFQSAISDGEPSTMTDVVSGVFNPIALAVLGAFGAQSFSNEYKFHTMRTTLTANPDRTKVFVAKLGLALAVVTACWAVLIVVAYAIGLVSPTGLEFLPGQSLRALLTVWGWVVLFQAITVFTRSLPMTLLIVFLLVGFVEKFPGIITIAPFGNSITFLSNGGLGAGALWIGWIAAAAAGSWWFFSTRDA